jgi:hypothetical protein
VSSWPPPGRRCRRPANGWPTSPGSRPPLWAKCYCQRCLNHARGVRGLSIFRYAEPNLTYMNSRELKETLPEIVRRRLGAVKRRLWTMPLRTRWQKAKLLSTNSRNPAQLASLTKTESRISPKHDMLVEGDSGRRMRHRAVKKGAHVVSPTGKH